MELAQRTINGVLWSYASFFGRRMATLFSTAILARLLIPEDFGLIAFAVIIITFIEATRGLGINDALIYTSDHVDEAADTAFVINVVLGLLQFVVVFTFSPLLVHVFDDARIVDVMRVISLVFIINGFGQTHDALLQKELQFKRRFLPELLATLIKGVASIIMALIGFGVWSLVFGQLIGAMIRTIAKWWMLRWCPRLRFHVERARQLWSYGIQVLMFQVLNIALDQADQVLIGTMIGQLQLGYYAIGARIPEMVIANFSLVLTRVLFPVFTKMKDDIPQLRASFLKTTKFTAFVTVPAGIGMTAVAHELILVVYGNQWEETIILLQVLSLLGMVGTLSWSAGDILKALGRPDISTKLLLIEALYTFPLIYFFISGSRLAVMASLANLIALCITAILRIYVVSRFLNMSPWIFITLLRAPFIGGVIMFGVVTAWRMLLVDMPMVLTLITSILLGALTYFAMLWMMEKEDIMRIYEMLMDFRRKKRLTGEKEADSLPTPTDI
jgi:O-antigen/teichoic acid export membrane protein